MSVQVQNVTKSFGDPSVDVLKNVSFDIQDGEFAALTGRSGSGKSTLLYILSTLDNATSGDVFFDHRPVKQMSSQELHQFRNQFMGFVFQFHYLLPELSSLENVLMPTRKLGLQNEKRQEAMELLRSFGLEKKLDNFPRQLSGGEQQRVAIARALIMNPKYLFADEPTGNLDSINGEVVMNLLKKVNQERKTTIIMVTHDPDFANLASRQIFLVDGRLVDKETR